MAGAGEIHLMAGWVADAVGGSVVFGGDREFAGVSIDSRTVAPGELFVAIAGDRFDGAAFAPAAAAAGAAGVLVPRGRGREIGDRGVAVIEVDDTVLALQHLARRVRRESGSRVVAITGSAGKTTTKEVTAELLASRYQVIRNRGNFNNHIGLPLSLIALRRRPDVAVVELGMNHAGEIRTLVGIAEPDVRVWTNVGEAHLGFFPSVEAIADAKAEILEGATRDTVLVSNADDPRVSKRAVRFAGRVVTFGLDQPADVRAVAVEDRGIDGIRARIDTPRGSCEIVSPLVGRMNLANVLAATAVALEFDVPLERVADRIRGLAPPARRGELRRLARGVTVIDDSYNANPTAMRQALEVLASAGGRRRVAVLGEMFELGEQSEALHADVGRAAAKAGVDLLMAVGAGPAASLARAAIEAGMPSAAVRLYRTSEEAAGQIAALVRDGDLVLVKGSRGVGTDRVVDRLSAELA